MEQVGVGEPRQQGRAGNVGGQGGQHAALAAGREVGLVEICLEDCGWLAVAQAGAQAAACDDRFAEQLVLRLEMRIERAARQAGRQHDIVDDGAGIAAQPEQPAGMIEDFGPGAGGSGGALGHDMLYNIPYVE
jgi:hypothetical protein